MLILLYAANIVKNRLVVLFTIYEPGNPFGQFVTMILGQIEAINGRIGIEFRGQLAAGMQNRLALDITRSMKLFEEIQNDLGCSGSSCFV